MFPDVIGLSGKMGVGKTTAAEIMRSRGLADRVLAFADPVKEEAARRFGFNVDLCYGAKDEIILHPDLPGGTMSVRRILQWWGTDVRRAEDPLYWVQRMEAWLRDMDAHRVVLHDVRFREEALWIREVGGRLYRIRPYPEWRPGPEARHRSETDLDDWEDWDGAIQPPYGELDLVAQLVSWDLSIETAK